MDIINEEYGTIKISEDVIVKAAANACMKTTGVHGLCENVFDVINKNFLGKETVNRGIKLSEENNEYVFDIYVIIEYAVRIPEVAYKIQQNVKNAVEELTGSVVHAVNIHVNEIYFPEGEENND